MKNRTPIFYLVGGVGNQLFGFAAGKAFSKKHKTPVLYDLSEVQKGFTNHGSSIEALSLDLEIALNRPRLHGIQNRVSNKLFRVFHKITNKSISSSKIYRSCEIGYDEHFLNSSSLHSIRGYFQSWKYVDAVYEVFPPSEVILKKPSQWFCKMSEMALLVNPIMLHVRRGDYKELSNTYGLLSADYYESSLQLVREFLPENPVWVFSDDIEDAKNLLSTVLPLETNWINPPLEVDPAESLVLMSFGAANIIANSTFSWWGAMLNRRSVVTLAPQKWFRGMPDPKDLYPPDWLQVSSSWLH